LFWNAGSEWSLESGIWNGTMKKKGLHLVLLLWMAAWLGGCGNSADSPEPVIIIQTAAPVTVEVTRYATVAVPVEVTREVVIEVLPEPEAVAGSADNPLLLLVAPIYDPAVTALRSTTLARALQDATGLAIQPLLPATHAEAIALACAAPDRTIALLSSLEYVLAARNCPLPPVLTGLRNGLPWSAAMLLVPESAEISTLADLDGKAWGVADRRDLAAGHWFAMRLAEAGVTPASMTPFVTDTATILALAEGRSDFATASFVPPVLPGNERPWQYGDDHPELWRLSGAMPERSGIGFVTVGGYVEDGGYQVRDARANALDVRRTIFAETRILELSAPMPNDVISLGAAMPFELARTLTRELLVLGASGQCVASLCAPDFFGWEGIAPVDDPAFDPVRLLAQKSRLTADDLSDYLNSAGSAP
jgi:ABC-type phosphate/phosphonate transport system substrate-binding protein